MNFEIFLALLVLFFFICFSSYVIYLLFSDLKQSQQKYFHDKQNSQYHDDKKQTIDLENFLKSLRDKND